MSSTTSIPSTFTVAFSYKFNDCNLTERQIHSKLADYRINEGREFFNCSLDKAIRVFYELIIEEYKYKINELNELLNQKTNQVSKIHKNKKYTKYKWDSFFNLIGWNYSKNEILNGVKNQPDFILYTKDWTDEPDEKYEKEIHKIFEKPTYIYIIDSLPDSSEKINKITKIKEITKDLTELETSFRLVVIGISPIKDISSIYLGWEYSAVNDYWSLIDFIQHYDNKIPIYGLLDDDRTWFCMIRGAFLKRDNFVIDEEALLEKWMKD